MYEFEKIKLYNYLGENLVDDLHHFNAIVAGGTITSLFSGNEINDIDIYFKRKDDALNFVTEVINTEWIISLTDKAVLFRYNGIECQVIFFDYFKTADDIFNSFDFTVCMGAFDFEKEEFILHDNFLKHNSQRILKFNKNTSFPIISALRVQKYENKGYKISKPEFLRIVLTINQLEINTYEQLKEQIGGMYGVNYDNLLEPKDDEKFNLNKIIDKMSDLIVDDSYFALPQDSFYIEIDDLITVVSGEKVKIFEFKDNYYYVRDFSKVNNEMKEEKRDFYDIIDINDVIKPGDKFYKFVEKRDDKYFSYYDNEFEYKIGEIVIANKNKEDCWGRYGLYVEELKNVNYATYNNRENNVLIELELKNVDDILSFNNLRLKKAEFIREVPENEYK